MDYHLHLTSEQFAVVWAALGELPGKHGFHTMQQLHAQVLAQEAAAKAPKTAENADGQRDQNVDRQGV